RLESIAQRGESTGLTSIQAYARFGLCLNAALSEDEGRLLQARSGLAPWTAGVDFKSLVEIVDFWIDPPPSDWEDFTGSEWLDGLDAARERWRRFLRARNSLRHSRRPDL